MAPATPADVAVVPVVIADNVIVPSAAPVDVIMTPVGAPSAAPVDIIITTMTPVVPATTSPVVAPEVVVVPVVDEEEEPEFVVESICGLTQPINQSLCENPGINCIFFLNGDPTTSITDATQCKCNINMWECFPFVGGIGETFMDDEFVELDVIDNVVVPTAAPVVTTITTMPPVSDNVGVPATAPPVLVTIAGPSTDTCPTVLPTTSGLAATQCALSSTQICCFGVQIATATVCTCTGNVNGPTFVCFAGTPNDCPDLQNPNVITSPPETMGN
jgi:hypothetical protein